MRAKFIRGEDPKKSLDIGIHSPRVAFDRLAIGDVFKLKKGIRDFGFKKGLYILVVDMINLEESGPFYKRIRYQVSDDFVTFRAPEGHSGGGLSGTWGLPYDFFAEYFEKAGRKEDISGIRSQG